MATTPQSTTKLKNNINLKYLPVTKLIEILSTLPDDVNIWPNRVGNLTVFKPQDEQEPKYLGFIDFIGEGEFIADGQSSRTIIE